MVTLQGPPKFFAEPTFTEMPITAVVRQCAVEVLRQPFSSVSLLSAPKIFR